MGSSGSKWQSCATPALVGPARGSRAAREQEGLSQPAVGVDCEHPACRNVCPSGFDSWARAGAGLCPLSVQLPAAESWGGEASALLIFIPEFKKVKGHRPTTGPEAQALERGQGAPSLQAGGWCHEMGSPQDPSGRAPGPGSRSFSGQRAVRELCSCSPFYLEGTSWGPVSMCWGRWAGKLTVTSGTKLGAGSGGSCLLTRRI